MSEPSLPLQHPAWFVAAAVALGAAGTACLLPRPRGRRVGVGVVLLIAAAVVAGVFAAHAFAGPGTDSVGERVSAGLFWLFASVAVSFAGVMIVQKNPARGAMAFAVSVLATCGLFLLLAAPFLMAATVVVYAGATIVTFLFVLMLSPAGPSGENDRTREPVLGSVAGLGFAGLVLFSLHLGAPGRAVADYPLPAEPVTAEEKRTLGLAALGLRMAADRPDPRLAAEESRGELNRLAPVLGGGPTSVPGRLRVAAADARTAGVVAQAEQLDVTRRSALADPSPANLRAVADGADLLRGRGELPARNVAAVGYSLYSEHLLTVELAGTLLLVATVGAVAVAGRGRAA